MTSGPDPYAAKRSACVALAGAVAALVVSLILPSHLLLSAQDTDMVNEFVAWRSFLADSLRLGHIPLWDPYNYAGEPFLGNFETGVFYPPNLLFLCLPLAVALNFSALLHLVILGWGMERWASLRGLHPWSAGLAALVMPLSGPVFSHVYAGHLSNLCTMAWAPWIFLGLEAGVRHGDRRGLFVAAAAICLQILGGQFQCFFCTAVAVGIQALVLTAAEPAIRRRALPAVISCYLVALALGAAQLLPGLAAAGESIRQQKLDYSVAAMFGFPPENFLTLIAPGFFGNLGQPVYWGRCYLWEMSLFFGAVSPLFIAIAFCEKGRQRRGATLDLIVAGLLLLLALGVHTPVFDLAYRFAPGFGYFRNWAKFTFPAMLFLVLVSVTGADALLRGKKIPRAIAWAGLLAGSVSIGAGLILLFEPQSIAPFLDFIVATHETYLSPAVFTNFDFILDAGTHAGLSLGLAGLILSGAGTMLLFLEEQPVFRRILPGLLAVEMIGFVAGQITIAHLSDAMPDTLVQFVTKHPGDYRVFDLSHYTANNGFLFGVSNLGGNNPSGLRRYAEFINFTEGDDPDHATQNLPFHSITPLDALLRFRYAVVPDSDRFRVVESPTPPLPRLLIVSDAKVLAGRDAIFSAMKEPAFDPARTALLESDPQPHPEAGATGQATLVSDSPDELIVEADTDRPALLLITDLYARDWRAESLPGSVQPDYRLMPADYILRAVPLNAGHHRLRIVYAPPSYLLGVAISAAAWVLWAGLFCRMRQPKPAPG